MWWKRFTGWDIGSTPNKAGCSDARRWPLASSQFRALSWRLLFTYLSAMGAVLGVFTLAIYQSVAHSVYENVDKNLVTLADAAAHTLPTILQDREALYQRQTRSLDDDGDLDIPWQDLQQEQQSVEWFDAKRRLLGRAGRHFPYHPLAIRFQTWQQDQLRSLTIPVDEPNQSGQVWGYVRVSTLIDREQAELRRLLAGMAWGALMAIILIGTTGWWLTRRSLRPIEQSFRQLKQFTADASHELRSPLTAIKTSVEVMQSHPERIHPSDTEKLNRIASATQQMTRLVEDLLLLARTDTSSSHALKHSPHQLVIPLNELLEDLVEALQPQAKAKPIKLTIEPLPHLPVRGEAAQLRRLFANLLENALHYTPAGTIQVALSPISDGEFVAIQIRDTGIGIAPEQQQQVFDRFWRADAARSRRAGGTGLGLSIAQAIAQSHGGGITVTSQVGLGSCFRVKLPLASAKWMSEWLDES